MTAATPPAALAPLLEQLGPEWRYAGLVAVDDKTLEYVKGRPFAPGTDAATGRFVGGPEW